MDSQPFEDVLQADQKLGLVAAFIAVVQVGGDRPSDELGKLAIDKGADRATEVAVSWQGHMPSKPTIRLRNSGEYCYR